jgi:hypothetical protein
LWWWWFGGLVVFGFGVLAWEDWREDLETFREKSWKFVERAPVYIPERVTIAESIIGSVY